MSAVKKKYHYLNDKELKPIILSNYQVAQIHIYSRVGEWLDIILDDCNEDRGIHFQNVMRESAREFIRQLRGNWCKAFMIALKKEIHDAINDRSKADYMRHARKP